MAGFQRGSSQAEAGARQPLISPGPKPAQTSSVEETVYACRRRHSIILIFFYSAIFSKASVTKVRTNRLVRIFILYKMIHLYLLLLQNKSFLSIN